MDLRHSPAVRRRFICVSTVLAAGALACSPKPTTNATNAVGVDLEHLLADLQCSPADGQLRALRDAYERRVLDQLRAGQVAAADLEASLSEVCRSIPLH